MGRLNCFAYFYFKQEKEKRGEVRHGSNSELQSERRSVSSLWASWLRAEQQNTEPSAWRQRSRDGGLPRYL